MASMFQSLLVRTAKLPTVLLQLLSRFPSASSSSSSICCRLIEEELKKLRRRMERTRAILRDAEELREEIREESVKIWLAELRDVAYNSEDVLEEVDYELLRCQLECEEEANSPPAHEEKRGIKRKREVSDPHVTPGRCPPLLDVSFRQKILAKIKEINDLFEEMHRDGFALKLHKEDEQGNSSSASLLQPSPRNMATSCLSDERGVHGRDEDKCRVIDLLVPTSGEDGGPFIKGEDNVRAVSIVGMGGVGKTTLAQLVYNDDQVRDRFGTRMWVCDSESFDKARLTREVLDALPERSRREVIEKPGNHPRRLLRYLCEVQESSSSNSSCYVQQGLLCEEEVQGSSDSSFNLLQLQLCEALEGKRFLLVLDDVWDEDQARWEALWKCLSRGAAGSRVLITTRSEKVSRSTCRVSGANMYRLGCLSREDCWSLFKQRAFGGRSSDDYPQLVPIGREIVTKCGGLPLTVKTLAGLLFSEFREDRWMDILTSELREIPEGQDCILRVLKLSYDRLPSPIKPCFLYCAVFPRGHLFDSVQLMRMWMAHGYIEPSATKCMEDVARVYFEELLQRSFFQKTGFYGQLTTMHDLFHDLASSIRSGECCEVVDGGLSGDHRRTRHLRFKHWADITRLFGNGANDNLLKMSRTSYLVDSTREHTNAGGSPLSKALDDMFLKMEHLRVLDLGRSSVIKELPESLGNLKHLRYLCLSGKHLKGLPDSLGNLLNLQTLAVLDQPCFTELPKSLNYLINLRHLDISSRSLTMMPRGIRRLTQLRTLHVFVVGDQGSGAAGIEELSALNDLQGRLNIVVKSLCNWAVGSGGGHDNYGRQPCVLKNKQGLGSLVLDFDVDSFWATKQQQRRQEVLMESLQTHPNTRVLHIRRYGGAKFPAWMGDASSSLGLERIYLDGCFNCRQLPALGQLRWLKFLRVSQTDAATGVVCEFLTGVPFPSLEVLVLEGLWECEGLVIGTNLGNAFPHLQHLKILSCRQLEYVKLRHLTALTALHVHTCQELMELDCYNDDQDLSMISCLGSSSSMLLELDQSQAIIDSCTHIPAMRSIRLWDCPKLDFPRTQQRQQQRQLLPPSLQRLDVTGSPRLGEWVRNHSDKVVRVPCLLMDDGRGQRHLSICNLQHVSEACEEGHLPRDTKVQKLTLRWDDAHKEKGSSPGQAEAEEVLEELYPDPYLKEVVMEGYKGRSFPGWVGDPGRLCHLVKMTLSGCVHCDRLPPVGRLPCLKQLHISWMPEVRRVGCEFCGHGGTFQSLQSLEFNHMPQWEEWQEVEDGAFPNLHVLRIYNCPKLNALKLTIPPPFKLESDSIH